jgi:hypothetical protein
MKLSSDRAARHVAGIDSDGRTVMRVAAITIALAFFVACGSEAGAPSSGPTTAAGEGPTPAAPRPPAPGEPATPGASEPAPPPGEPLPSAPDETWTWIDVPGTACANGTPTGVGVNYTKKSTDVLVFLEGGGACWDGATCYGGQSIATYLTGYGKLEFETDPQRVLFTTTRDSSNPFRNMNMIYVPYCTGDVHAGNNVVTHSYLGIEHPTHHVGGKNLAIVLSRVAATFPSAKNVWIAGDSAGGFGAALSVPVARKAFPKARLGIVDDSGQPVAPAAGRWGEWRDAWKLTSPAGCSACDNDPSAYVTHYQTSYRDVTFALLSYSPDPVISAFMGISLSQFSTELSATLAAFDKDPGAKARYFIAPGSSHVVMTVPTPALDMWLQQAIDGSPSWQNQK